MAEEVVLMKGNEAIAHSGKKKPHPTPSPMASTTRGSSPNLNFIGE